MARRHSDDDMIWGLGLVCTVVLGLLGLQSGVLPWAIAGGVAVAGIILWYTREWGPTFIAGGLAAAVILLLGGMSVLSPGWYQGLLLIGPQ